MGSGAVSQRRALPSAVTQLEWSTAHLSWHSAKCVGAVGPSALTGKSNFPEPQKSALDLRLGTSLTSGRPGALLPTRSHFPRDPSVPHPHLRAQAPSVTASAPTY